MSEACTMKILAIDSSALCASAAVCDGEKRIAEAFVNTVNTHSETLLPMVESVLQNANMTVDDVDMLACTVGPGSFTGVRIGVSLIKGLAFGKEKICVGVSTLEACATALADIKGLVVAVSDARRCGLYNAVFECGEGKVKRLTPDKLDLPEQLVSECEKLASERRLNLYFVGDGCKRAFELKKSKRVKKAPELLGLISAYGVAQCALKKYEEAKDKTVFDDRTLAACYLRPAQAERERLERLAINEVK